MQNIAMNTCENFHGDWSRNDGALGDWKSDNNNPKKNNNVRSVSRPVSRSKNSFKYRTWKLQLNGQSVEYVSSMFDFIVTLNFDHWPQI